MSRRALAPFLVAGALLWALAACAPGGEAPQTPDVARYVALPIKTGSAMEYFRFDTATGALVRAPLIGGRTWQPVGETPPPDAFGPQPGRYAFDVAASASLPLTFLRVDSLTGRAWRLPYKGGKKWIAFRESDDAAPQKRGRRGAGEEADAAAAAAPAPSSASTAPPPTAGQAAEDAPTKQQKLDLEQLELAVDTEFFRSEDRAWAVEEIAKLPRSLAVPGILHSLESDDAAVLSTAAKRAGSLGITAAIPKLEALSAHESADVQKDAERSLKRLRSLASES